MDVQKIKDEIYSLIDEIDDAGRLEDILRFLKSIQGAKERISPHVLDDIEASKSELIEGQTLTHEEAMLLILRRFGK